VTDKVTTNILWCDLYAAAMLELDHANLHARIEAARAGIQRARKELTRSATSRAAAEEMQSMADALRNLDTLQWVELRASAPTRSQGLYLSLSQGEMR
jgi:hypothetical protein